MSFNPAVMENMLSQTTEPLKLLDAADPQLAGEVSTRLARMETDPASAAVEMMVRDVIYGLSLDTSLGRTIADGCIRMIAAGVKQDRLDHYSRIIHREGGDNTTYAGILAGSIVDVLIWGDDTLIDDFLNTAALLKRKWLYALSAEPLNVVSRIIGPDDTEAGTAWLGFLSDIFAHDLTYNQFRRFSGVFPKAVCAWPAAKRFWRINQLRRVARRDFNLACIFADAFSRELSLLSENGLEVFVSEGLARYNQNETRGAKFLGLSTRSAMDACNRLRTTGVLALNRRQLAAYLQARCGRALPIKPISALSSAFEKQATDGALVCFDGRTLFLADEISRYATHLQNDFLYKALAWIEAGLFEFATFDFDLEKISAPEVSPAFLQNIDNDGVTDLDRFFKSFREPSIARDLFTVFEYGRIRTLLESTYPGGAARFYPLIREEAERLLQSASDPGFMSILFSGIALGADMYQWVSGQDKVAAARGIMHIFDACTSGENRSEASAIGILRILNEERGVNLFFDQPPVPLIAPYGFSIRPNLFYAAFSSYEKQAGVLKSKIAGLAGESVHKSVIRRRLIEQGGVLSAEDVREMINEVRLANDPADDKYNGMVSLSDIDMDELYGDTGISSSRVDDFVGITFRYHEWDHHIGDYLADHVLVRQRALASETTDFYQATLSRYSGLVKKIRYAFEMLKPEGISILRKWREGEDFDYRQLLEYAIDKKSGRTPSERIYIKRLKQQRDVAALLLLDFSRSTSNIVAGSDTTMVLDVEKEALVLFCEALKVTGDAFAIAGFSGTGRLGVDYFPVKSFNEPITADVEHRIGMVSPQRNTRMGAAIRHATSVFADMPTRTKLLIVISDGFPNDIDYKREYALADTRRALLEARARGIIAHSITINIAGDSTLDDLYGRVRHSVISDVRELPDRLIRIYGRLTG